LSASISASTPDDEGSDQRLAKARPFAGDEPTTFTARHRSDRTSASTKSAAIPPVPTMPHCNFSVIGVLLSAESV
jgi:hypothetical protein